MAERYEIAHVERRRRVEYKPVEHRVEDISGSSSHNHAQTYNISCACLLPHLQQDVIANHRYGHYSKNAQHIFVDKRHPVGHPVVLNEVDVKPARYLDALMQAHVGLDLYLDDLVNHQDRYHNQHSQPAVG